VIYVNRGEAGDLLASQLTAYADRPDVVVLGLVRGGVPVAVRVSAALRVPLDVLVVRKLGVPGAPEVAFGALGPNGVAVRNPAVETYVSDEEADAVSADAADEVDRREALYRRGKPPLALTGRTAIVVDDGLATGATARAAVAVARVRGAASVVLAVPVAAPEAIDLLRHEADEVVCPLVADDFVSVSSFYNAFPQIDDDEVIELTDAG
jgi:predicted phosphoribosyltransferase